MKISITALNILALLVLTGWGTVPATAQPVTPSVAASALTKSQADVLYDALGAAASKVATNDTRQLTFPNRTNYFAAKTIQMASPVDLANTNEVFSGGYIYLPVAAVLADNEGGSLQSLHFQGTNDYYVYGFLPPYTNYNGDYKVFFLTNDPFLGQYVVASNLNGTAWYWNGDPMESQFPSLTSGNACVFTPDDSSLSPPYHVPVTQSDPQPIPYLFVAHNWDIGPGYGCSYWARSNSVTYIVPPPHSTYNTNGTYWKMNGMTVDQPGNVTARSFSGNGSGVTNLDGANLQAGTVGASALAQTYLTAETVSQLYSAGAAASVKALGVNASKYFHPQGGQAQGAGNSDALLESCDANGYDYATNLSAIWYSTTAVPATAKLVVFLVTNGVSASNAFHVVLPGPFSANKTYKLYGTGSLPMTGVTNWTFGLYLQSSAGGAMPASGHQASVYMVRHN